MYQDSVNRVSMNLMIDSSVIMVLVGMGVCVLVCCCMLEVISIGGMVVIRQNNWKVSSCGSVKCLLKKISQVSIMLVLVSVIYLVLIMWMSVISSICMCGLIFVYDMFMVCVWQGMKLECFRQVQ